MSSLDFLSSATRLEKIGNSAISEHLAILRFERTNNIEPSA